MFLQRRGFPFPPIALMVQHRYFYSVFYHLFGKLILSYVVCVFMCVCKHRHTYVMAWHTCKGQRTFPSSALFETWSFYCFSAEYTRLASLTPSRASPFSTSHLPTGALGLQTHPLCLQFFSGLWEKNSGPYTYEARLFTC